MPLFFSDPALLCVSIFYLYVGEAACSVSFLFTECVLGVQAGCSVGDFQSEHGWCFCGFGQCWNTTEVMSDVCFFSDHSMGRD